MSAPGWAVALLEWVCREEGMRVPRLTWSRRSALFSSGRATMFKTAPERNRIYVSTGSNLADARHVLLHEIAHHVVGICAKHSDDFYRVNFRLQARWGDLRYSVHREQRYRPGAAVRVARSLGCRIPPRDAALVPPEITGWHIWQTADTGGDLAPDDPAAAPTPPVTQRRLL